MKKTKTRKKIGDIIINIILILSFVVLGLAIVTAVKYKENPEDAYLFGYKPVYVMTGSMEPTLREKGICIVQKTDYDSVDVDDIIMYQIDDKIITHRIIEKTEEGIRTKGDNNNVNDAYLLQEENVLAEVVCIFNFTATIVNDFQAGPIGFIKWIGYPIFIIVVIVVATKIIKRILKKEEKENADKESENT